MSRWQLAPDLVDPAARLAFCDLASVFALTGERVTSDKASELLRCRIGEQIYYVKRYRAESSFFRRWIISPRVRFEWRNLQRFADWGVPTAEIVAWGMVRRFGVFCRGAVITRELPGVVSLFQLAATEPLIFRTQSGFSAISRRVAGIVRVLHEHRFAHNDLHWRNLLYHRASGQVFLIDCPNGRFWPQPFLSYRIAKDLAALDRGAQQILRRTQRLRFYLDYAGVDRLDARHKQVIQRIYGAFENRMRRKKLLT